MVACARLGVSVMWPGRRRDCADRSFARGNRLAAQGRGAHQSATVVPGPCANSWGRRLGRGYPASAPRRRSQPGWTGAGSPDAPLGPPDSGRRRNRGLGGQRAGAGATSGAVNVGPRPGAPRRNAGLRRSAGRRAAATQDRGFNGPYLFRFLATRGMLGPRLPFGPRLREAHGPWGTRKSAFWPRPTGPGRRRGPPPRPCGGAYGRRSGRTGVRALRLVKPGRPARPTRRDLPWWRGRPAGGALDPMTAEGDRFLVAWQKTAQNVRRPSPHPSCGEGRAAAQGALFPRLLPGPNAWGGRHPPAR